MTTQEQIDSLTALIGAPSKGRNDQGEFEFDILAQIKGLRMLSSMQASVNGAASRVQRFSSMCNRFSPPSV